MSTEPHLKTRHPLIVLMMCAICAVGCSSDNGETPKDSDAPSENAARQPVLDPDEIPMPEFKTGLCRIYGGDPAAWVLVDGQPARSPQGEMVSPPCEVVVPQGSRTIALTRPGFQDVQRVILVSELAEVAFPALKSADENSVVTANTPLFAWPVGKPFPLSQVNSAGPELDPFLSPDGLTLWFVGNGDNGKSIYVAHRESIWHDFGPPEGLLLSRGPNLPASPSVTADLQSIYYAQPENARIVTLTRDSPLGEFRDRQKIQYDAEAKTKWMTCQVLPDNLRMYWTTVESDQVTGYAAVRNSTNESFSQPIEYPLPGLIPMLSSDGLRQYQFDGTKLRRSRRVDLSSDFSQPETLHTLSLSDYNQESNRRQFFVSDDEQWMVYSAGETDRADLYLVRLSKSVGWGVVARGKPIPPKPVEVAEKMERDPDPQTEMKPADDSPPEVDPRSLPLPYQEYLVDWKAALAERDYNTARKLTAEALDDSELAESRKALEANRHVLEQIAESWSLLEKSAKSLEPESSVPLGTARAKFENFENGVLTFRVGSQRVEKEVKELPLLTIINLIQKAIEPDDGKSFAALAYFLIYDGESKHELALNRVKEFPKREAEIIGEINRHHLHRAKQEFARENYSAGIVLLREVLEKFPESPAADEARKLEQSLYRLTELEAVGTREWGRNPELGEYEAKPGRSDNSYLKSTRPYRSFELQFEWKTVGSVGQGGVYFHYAGNGPVFNNAYKIHLGRDYGVPADQYCSGSLFGLEAPEQNAVNPNDQWNTSRLIVRGSSITFILNGEKVLDTFALRDDLPEEGYVFLDGVTGGIIYRKVLLTELP